MTNYQGSWYGPDFWGKIALVVSQIWLFVSVGTQVMMMTVWVMIFVQNIDVFENVNGKYMGNNGTKYDQLDGHVGTNYVAGTNMPKQLGGAIFASLFAVAMWIFILISLAADVAWRFPIVRRFLALFHSTGLWNDEDITKFDYNFLLGNAMLKVFITVATGSTSWRGLLPNNTVINTETFCLYATFAFLVNIIPAYVTTQICITATNKGLFSAKLGDVESAAKSAGRDEGKAEAQKEAKKKAERPSKSKPAPAA